MKPNPGDIISARYRWSDQKDEEVGQKIRPCLVIKAAEDGSAMIIAPISTKEGWKAIDCIEIPPDDRAAAGVHSEKRSWVKLTEINKIDLPNLAVIPHVGPDGKMHWRRGRASDAMMKQVTEEIAIRINDKTLKGSHVKSDAGARIKLAGIRKIETSDQISTKSETIDQRIKRRAADLAASASKNIPQKEQRSQER